MEGPFPAERLWPSHWTGALSRAWHCVSCLCGALGQTWQITSYLFSPLWLIPLEMQKISSHSHLYLGFFFFLLLRQLRTHSYYLLKKLFTQKPKRRPDARNDNRQTTWWFVLWVCVDCGWWTYHFQSILSQKYFGRKEKLFSVIAFSDWQLPGNIFR